MRILVSVVYPAPRFLLVSIYYDHHRCAIGTQFVRYNNSRSAIAFHGISFEFQRGCAISVLTHITFQNFTFVINCSPKVMPFPIGLHERLIEVPLPVRVNDRVNSPFSPNLCGKNWLETLPPKPDCFMTYINAPFIKQVFYIPNRNWEPNIQL